jgi:L-fucose isomerase-like protein
MMAVKMKRPAIGFFTCVHPFYDLPAVAEARRRAIEGLRECGCEVTAAPLARNSRDAIEAAAEFRRSDIDLAVLFFCTWVAEDITLALARELMDVPMLLWALPYLDKDIPMPSPMSGLTASGSNIRRMGKRFAYQVGQVTPLHIARTARAGGVGAVARALSRARFGVAGKACPGMLDVGVDEAELQKALGVTTVHLDLDGLLAAAGAASPEEVAHAAGRLGAAPCGPALEDNLRLYVAIKETVRRNALDGYCVRCWPELRDQHKITPCVAHALMAGDGVANTCEVDLTALITTFVLSRLAGAPAFNFDITAYLEEEGAVQFAHCGAAAPSLAAGPEAVALRTHMRTGTGATLEFPFPEGDVTLAKLQRPLNGEMTLFAAAGRTMPSDGARGSVATVRPEPSAAAFLDRVMRDAVEHHIALVYGSWLGDLEMFCDFTGLRYAPLR